MNDIMTSATKQPRHCCLLYGLANFCLAFCHITLPTFKLSGEITRRGRLWEREHDAAVNLSARKDGSIPDARESRFARAWYPYKVHVLRGFVPVMGPHGFHLFGRRSDA